MSNAKKIFAAFAIALMASAGTVTPAEAAGAPVSQKGDSWCC